MTIIFFNLAIILGAVVLALIVAAMASRPEHVGTSDYFGPARDVKSAYSGPSQLMGEQYPELKPPPAGVVAAGMQ